MTKEDEQLASIYAQIPKRLKQDFQIIAKRDGVKDRELLINVIESYVKAHIEGNDQHYITSWLDNEDFIGFPSIALTPQQKKQYIFNNLVKDGKLTQQGQVMFGHVDEWHRSLIKL